MSESQATKMTRTELTAFARFNDLRAQINTDERQVASEIEARLGLPEGSLGKTHALDLTKGLVTEMPRQSDPMGGNPQSGEEANAA